MNPRDLLFADHELEGLLALPSGDRGPSPRSDRNPWPLLFMARELREAGRREEAKAILRSVAEHPGVETRVQLWAWRSLRGLGEAPGDSEGREVLGVVVELPVSAGFDALAAYRDGSARYVSHAGETLVAAGEDALERRARRLVEEGQRLVDALPWAPRRVPARGRTRFTLLTRRGHKCAEEELALAGKDGRFLSPAFRAGAELLACLWRVAKTRRR